MSAIEPNLPPRSAERLSAVFDGEADADEIKAVCADWGQDGEPPGDWLAYGVIGDVLRSAELARPATRDRQIFQAIQARLREEPVVLAPSALPRPAAASPALSARRRQRGWMQGAGIAAGLAMVGGLVWQLQGQPGAVAPDTGGAQLAVGTSAAPTLAPAALLPATLGGSPTAAASGADAPVEPYLRAHRAIAAGIALDPGPAHLRRVSQEPGNR